MPEDNQSHSLYWWFNGVALLFAVSVFGYAMYVQNQAELARDSCIRRGGEPVTFRTVKTLCFASGTLKSTKEQHP